MRVIRVIEVELRIAIVDAPLKWQVEQVPVVERPWFVASRRTCP